jgi:hypothetical protein
MLNLHAPFRRAVSGDETRIAKLAGGAGATSIEDTVVADETGRITAVLSGAPEGETWRITSLEIAPERLAELAPRILAVADALAADEGLASVTLEASGFAQDMLAIVDQEGFRPAPDAAGQGGSRTLVRPVVPQG